MRKVELLPDTEREGAEEYAEFDVNQYMQQMFDNSKFDNDISKWQINNDCVVRHMFDNCPIRKEYKPKRRNKKIR